MSPSVPLEVASPGAQLEVDLDFPDREQGCSPESLLLLLNTMLRVLGSLSRCLGKVQLSEVICR